MKQIDWTGILGLVGSAIGGCAIMVAFVFTTFETKSEAQVVADHAETQQQNLKDDLHALRQSLDHLHDKVDRILEHMSYAQ